MARIAYVDHSFHKKTLSTGFLPEILRRHGHAVDYFWDESWSGGSPVTWGAVANHDAVIMFQAYSPILEQYYRQLHPNVIFIPMLDQFGIWRGPLFNLSRFWEPFQGSKIISFSGAVHAIAVSNGISSYQCRYYQKVAEKDLSETDGMHGFFWLRREDQIPWKTIRTLISESNFDSFHIHLASDPGSPQPELPSEDDIGRFKITTSTWFKEKTEIEKVLMRANVFFCPRMEEGIGQSFLEALSRGQCVVAPNHGTMNEYILHGVNGLLYDRSNSEPLCFDHSKLIGRTARKSVAIGRRQWEQDEERLVRYILTPSEAFYAGKYIHQMAEGAPYSWINSCLRYAAHHNSIIKTAGQFLKSLKRRAKTKLI